MGKLTDAIRAEATGYGETEWSGKIGGQEVTLYSKPLTPADYERFLKGAEMPTPDMMINILIAKCTDADGEKAFDKGDKPAMRRFKISLIGDIFGTLYKDQIEEDTEDEFEERVKN